MGDYNEEEQGKTEKEHVLAREKEDEEYKADHLNTYFENFSLTPETLDSNEIILKNLVFKDFGQCIYLLKCLEDTEFIFKYKNSLSTKCDEMVSWFLHIFLSMGSDRPIPPYTDNNRKAALLDHFLVVNKEGGQKILTNRNMWGLVAKYLGFDTDEGYMMRIVYAQYLDMLEYNYKNRDQKIMKAEDNQEEKNEEANKEINAKPDLNEK
ncbi:hypothetical protein L1987_27114 [Smallanthus sonchifolius]|uniref:Uncharacterized protein n=1 Tax=Smallanthus sonchifolius TaxID=185202 RepID=A0ACB9IDC7_9ASTR|nr:hypothetical protein L1987_27114 [Smallanthus sonchifolius]